MTINKAFHFAGLIACISMVVITASQLEFKEALMWFVGFCYMAKDY